MLTRRYHFALAQVDLTGTTHILYLSGGSKTGMEFFYLSFWTIFFWGGGLLLALRGRWDAVYQHSGRDGGKTVVTEGGVEDELSVCREGWEVYV